MSDSQSIIFSLVEKYQRELLQDWLHRMGATSGVGGGLQAGDTGDQARRFLEQFRQCGRDSRNFDASTSEWAPLRDLLEDLSRDRAMQGFSPRDTATFVFSLYAYPVSTGTATESCGFPAHREAIVSPDRADRYPDLESVMTDDDIDADWSRRVAMLAADALMTAKIVGQDDVERVSGIIAEEIYVRLALRDGPDRENWRYNSNGTVPDVQ